MSGHRERVLSSHTLTVLKETLSQSGTGGTKRTWSIDPARDPLPCHAKALTASDDVVMSQTNVRVIYRLRFFYDPLLSPENRVRLSPTPQAPARDLVVKGEAIDVSGKGWMWVTLAEYLRTDQQSSANASFIPETQGGD